MVKQVAEGGRDGVLALGIEVPAGIAADFGQGRRIGQGGGYSLRHRLDHRDAETLAERRKDQGGRLGIQRRAGPCPGDSLASG